MTLLHPPFDPELGMLLAGMPPAPDRDTEAQVLICPMLDHRNAAVSSLQYAGGPGVWTREMNEFGWRSALFPHARLSAAARRTRTEWLARILTPAGAEPVARDAVQGAGR